MTPDTIPDELYAALSNTAADFAQARTPPGRLFHDSAIYEAELETIFGRMWLCVGHRSRLATPGDFFTVDLGRESIIVTMDSAGETHAFLNVCRHRGTRVSLETSGRCRGFLCPYHAWRYDLDGSLVAAPGMEAVKGFSKDDYPLIEVALETFRGFLFINLRGHSADGLTALADSFDDFPALRRYRLDNLVRVARHEYDVASNWKLICQNYHECYHCGIAHPQLHRISDYGQLTNAESSGKLFIGGPMAIKPGFQSMTVNGMTSRAPFAGLEGDDLRTVHYFNLLPNFLLSIAPDYVLTHHVWPRGPESVFIETEWFCQPEQLDADDFDISDAEEFWDTTNQQDWQLCQNALKGLKSAHHRPGRYHPSEDCAHRFDQWYVKRMFPNL